MAQSSRDQSEGLAYLAFEDSAPKLTAAATPAGRGGVGAAGGRQPAAGRPAVSPKSASRSRPCAREAALSGVSAHW